MSAPHPTFREAFYFWLKLGFISFGGPAGQIAIMQTELVERKRWISQDRFLHALNFCMLLPGPEAQQLTIYCGWLLHRTWGGIVAGTLFVLPSAMLLWGFSYVYVRYGELPWLAAFFEGLKPAVVAIVVHALIRLSRKTLRHGAMVGLAAAAFILIFFLKVPFPALLFGAAVIGFAGGRYAPGIFSTTSASPPVSGGRAPANLPLLAEPAVKIVVKPSWGRAVRVTATCTALWFAPLIAAGLWQGRESTLVQEGLFFSKAAMVTFGGAYAVLPYVAQQAVETHGWLTAPQMLDGLAFAETKPGPLIMVLQFVGFMGGWNDPHGLPPLVAATLGAALTTWVTFIPCFMWIFLGAPHVEQLRGHRGLNGALSAVTAAVVGVVLNLAVWFGLHVFWPEDGRFDVFSAAVGLAAFLALHRYRANLLWVIAGAGLAGIAWSWRA